MGRMHWGGRDVLVVTFGNGVGISRRAAERAGVSATIFDLRWLAPLPVLHLLSVVAAFPRVLVVDETRRSGGVSEGVVTALVEGGYAGSSSGSPPRTPSCRSGRPPPTWCSPRTTSWLAWPCYRRSA